MNKFIAFTTIKSNNNPVWHNKIPTNLKNKKTKAYKKYRLDKDNSERRVAYLQLEKVFEILNEFLYQSYMLSLEEKLQCNSNYF